MEKRSYNIFFDLHTVSGIVISVLVYVIFFAGTFSFFRDEIVNWERNEPVSNRRNIQLNIDSLLVELKKDYNLYSRDINFTRPYDERRVQVYMSDSKDTTLTEEARAGAFFYVDPDNFERHEYEESYTLGEFLYRLHFFAQVPYPAGYYLSGLTALFLFFAVLTGFLVHWKKIVSNFYVFRPREKLKTVWTDAHTVLGTLGLPFQTVYAVTGAFFMINIFLLVPDVMVLYDGDEAKLYDDLGYEQHIYAFGNSPLHKTVDVNAYVEKAGREWNDFDINTIILHNYGDTAMHVTAKGELKTHIKFAGLGEMTFLAATGTLVKRHDPHAPTSYVEGVKHALYRLHYGDYGGYGLRGISFVLGLLSCFVVITGILVWLEARNKKHIPEKQKRFNTMTGHIYLSICLTMFPVTAITFIVTQLVPRTMDDQRMNILYGVFFGTWLLMTILFVIKRNNFFTTRWTLLIGGLAGLCIPVVNGIDTGNWLWHSIHTRKTDLIVVDVLWICLGAAALWSVFRMKERSSAKISAAEKKAVQMT